MALPRLNHGITPWRTRHGFSPNYFRGCQPSPSYGHHGQGITEDDWKGYKERVALHDRTFECNGDLGWTLGYATAWCYRHLVGNQPLVADTIDTMREFDPEYNTPFQIFEILDAALFGSKLRGMVCLAWKQHWSCSPGTTAAPGILGIPRIVIQLNWTLFEDGDAEIDELLDALIHHMIHAYFLVCCGAQKKGDKQDGRLLDGTHFGVILMTIRDITKQCDEGVLPMTFHAAKRKELDNGNYAGALMAHKPPMHPGNSSALPYISLDPRGCGAGPALADGQTHCMHDNRMISYQAIKNWQVNDYSRALDTDMESKGVEVYEYEPDGKLTPLLRLHAPPSATYAELVWDRKHVMVSREKALRFKSIDWPLKKHERYELEIPKCDIVIFTCIYDFLNKGCYPGSEKIVWDPLNLNQTLREHRQHAGPPVFVAIIHGADLHSGVIKHVKVFKVAEKLKFTELMDYALARLWEMPKTTDDPIETLRWLYDDLSEQQPGPIHSELHKWARAFLGKTDKRLRLQHPSSVLLAGHRQGTSNMQKIARLYPIEFRELYKRSRAFQDDVKLARAELMMSRTLGSQGYDCSGHQRLQPLGLEAAMPMAGLHSTRGGGTDGGALGLLALGGVAAAAGDYGLQDWWRVGTGAAGMVHEVEDDDVDEV